MWNEPSPSDLARLPRLYATEHLPWQDKTIYEHFFFGSSDWYAAEYDPGDRLFFGYAILNDDYQNADWAYFSLYELKAINIRGFEIDRDLFWKPQPAGGIERIVRGMRPRDSS